MTRKWPDTQVRREIPEFNREFLELVCAFGSPDTAYGLDASVCQRLRQLNSAQLQSIADTPCLLVAFATFPPPPVVQGVADAPLPVAWSPQADAARLFAASLLTWLWHTASRDQLLATLCIGPGQRSLTGLRETGFRDLQRLAASASESLEARFCRHPRLWPDLVRAASTADPRVLTATRLSVVQLTLISRR